MAFYILTISALMILALVTRNDPRNSHIIFNISIVFVWFVVAFRYQVGCDWIAYEVHYNFQTPGVLWDKLHLVEPAYWMTLDLVHYLGLPFETINIITSTIFFIGFFFLARTQPNPMTVLAIAYPVLIFALPMSAIRQAAAMGFLMPAMVFFVRRNFMMYCALVFAGFLFHTSAIAFLPLAFFLKFKLSARNMILMSPILLWLVLRLLNLEGVILATDRYVDNELTNAAGAPFRTFILFACGLFFLILVRKIWTKFNSSDYQLIFIGAWLLIITFPLTLIVPTIADRFGYYFIIFQALIFGRLHYLNISYDDFYLIIFFIFTLMFFAIWWQLSWQLPYCYDPYRNLIWLER